MVYPPEFDVPVPTFRPDGGLATFNGGGGSRGPSPDEIRQEDERLAMERERMELERQALEAQLALAHQPPPEPPPPPPRQTTNDTVQAQQDARRQAARQQGLQSTRRAGATGGFLSRPLGGSTDTLG